MNNTETSLEKFRKRIGNNIRTIREFKKISQEPLCERINKSQPALSRYENGHSSMSIDTFLEICQYLGVSPEIMISKDLSFSDYSYLFNEITNPHTLQERKHSFEDRILNLYYLSTSQSDQLIVSDLITTRFEKGNYIPFLFEVKQNSPDKQIYDGNLVFENQHAYFYFKNKSRNERGLIITYIYPQKNKDTPIALLGVMLSISHGYEQRPCSQKCFITSQNVDLKALKEFLKINTPADSFVNDDFMITVSKSSDRKIYDWINQK